MAAAQPANPANPANPDTLPQQSKDGTPAARGRAPDSNSPAAGASSSTGHQRNGAGTASALPGPAAGRAGAAGQAGAPAGKQAVPAAKPAPPAATQASAGTAPRSPASASATAATSGGSAPAADPAARYYYSRQRAERDTPSYLLDGMSVGAQKKLRRRYTNALVQSGATLRVPISTVSYAVLLTHRFFAARSMARTDALPVATAALLLSTKIDDTEIVVEAGKPPAPPRRHLDQVAGAMFKHWHTRVDEQMLARVQAEPDIFRQDFLPMVLQAEFELLCTLDFDVHPAVLDHPYHHAVSIMQRFGLSMMVRKHLEQRGKKSERATLEAMATEMLDFMLPTTLLLQHPPKALAAGAIQVVLLHLQQLEGLAEVRVFTAKDTQRVAPWWQHLGIADAVLEDVVGQIRELLAPDAPKAAGKRKAAAAAAVANGAPSAASKRSASGAGEAAGGASAARAGGSQAGEGQANAGGDSAASSAQVEQLPHGAGDRPVAGAA